VRFSSVVALSTRCKATNGREPQIEKHDTPKRTIRQATSWQALLLRALGQCRQYR
jgi:hypothetical protein